MSLGLFLSYRQSNFTPIQANYKKEPQDQIIKNIN
jgi:hypothetical protein